MQMSSQKIKIMVHILSELHTVTQNPTARLTGLLGHNWFNWISVDIVLCRVLCSPAVRNV